MKPVLLGWVALLVLSGSGSQPVHAEPALEVDLCIYGGTAGGVAAGLAAARRGASVIIVEPMRHLGGMHGGGIRIQQDCQYRKDIGGIAKELHDADYALPGGGSANQWQARLMLRKKVEEAGIRCFTEHRLDGREDVVKDGALIKMIRLNYAPIMDEGVPPPQPAQRQALTVKARMFIDASYEGDLLAFAGCAFVSGRESKDQYGESLAGQGRLRHFDVDPYVVPGNPASGLLPMISTEPYEPGKASRYMLAYNFRMNGLRDAESQDGQGTPLRPLGKEIDRQRFELVIRGLKKDAGRKIIGWPSANYARTAMVSGGPPGRQADYPDGTWAVRSAIWREWIDFAKTMNELCGLKHPVLLKGDYPDNNDFPDQLYVSMGRRLIGEYVVTQHDLMHQAVVNDSIGLAYYYVDIYPTRLIADSGKVASEGEMFIRACPGPYPISYRSLIPQKGQCENLLVPVCMSASHVAMASIRMESSYVVMGEAAGIAASHALKAGQTVHGVDFEAVRADLQRARVVTAWDGTGYGPKRRGQQEVYWKTHPEDYKKLPLRLDPSWAGYVVSTHAPGFQVEGFASLEEWKQGKPGYEWLFPFIDANSDGKISSEEHRAFQDYKRKNPDWATALKKKLSNKQTDSGK
ncbi:MAG: FAD-dependent oxidoreductase [Kiritimatiellaeota bacterium]|nr:FAD-dependent oxidoreductase [Kiritimatiellota bacterium]